MLVKTFANADLLLQRVQETCMVVEGCDRTSRFSKVDHGGVGGRDEGRSLQVKATLDAGFSFISCFHDIANAFPSMAHSCLRNVLEGAALLANTIKAVDDS